MLHRLDSRLDVAVPGNQHDLGVGRILLRLPEDRQTVQVFHAKVGHDDIKLFFLDLLGTRRTAGRDDALVAQPLQTLGDGPEIDLFTRRTE